MLHRQMVEVLDLFNNLDRQQPGKGGQRRKEDRLNKLFLSLYRSTWSSPSINGFLEDFNWIWIFHWEISVGTTERDISVNKYLQTQTKCCFISTDICVRLLFLEQPYFITFKTTLRKITVTKQQKQGIKT